MRMTPGGETLEFAYVIQSKIKGRTTYLASQDRHSPGLYWTTDPCDAIRFVSARTARLFMDADLDPAEQVGVTVSKQVFGDELLLEQLP